MSQDPSATTPESPQAPSTELSQDQLQLAQKEGLNTQDVLQGFKGSIDRGYFSGKDSLAIARGVMFLDTIIAQNAAHLASVETKLRAIVPEETQ